MTHWYTYGENLEQVFAKQPQLQGMEAELEVLQKRIRLAKDAIRTAWFFDTIENHVISAEAENGSTAALLGSDILVNAYKEFNGFADVEYFTFDGYNTYSEPIKVHANQVTVFDNGTIQFLYEGKTHYVFIPEWKKLLSTEMISGLGQF